MPLPKTHIEITGPEHSGKTTLAVLLGRILEQHGAKVTLQQIDPQFDEKNSATNADLARRVEGMEILITEMQTR